MLSSLTHWGRVMHICVAYLTIIASDNGLSPSGHQAIIWTNAGIWLIRPLGTNFSEILIEILKFPFIFHLADDIFKCIFVNENVWIPIKISLKFVPKGLINNIPALVQIMAWRRAGDKPLSEPMIVKLPTHIYVIRPQWVNILNHQYERLRWVRVWTWVNVWARAWAWAVVENWMTVYDNNFHHNYERQG